MLWLLTDFEDPSMRVKERWEFIKLTRHAFGRTALVLSGGGALGAFHLVSDARQALGFINPSEWVPSGAAGDLGPIVAHDSHCQWQPEVHVVHVWACDPGAERGEGR